MVIRTNLLWVLVAGLLLLPAAAASAVAQDEGIKVHGAWAIEVLNPDGTVASRTEFANALRPGGARSLVELLGRRGSAGKWLVGVYMQGGGTLYGRSMTEGNTEGRPLSVAIESTPGSPAALVLRGSFPVAIVPEAGVSSMEFLLDYVTTVLEICQSPSECESMEFSSRNPSVRFQGEEGQTVQVTVRFTFS